MNRIISLSVEDMYIKYTGEAFGATGSHNAVTLRMTFGPAWEGTAKTAYFTDALGNTSVALVLGLDTLVDGAYEVDVPSEALKPQAWRPLLSRAYWYPERPPQRPSPRRRGISGYWIPNCRKAPGTPGPSHPATRTNCRRRLPGLKICLPLQKRRQKQQRPTQK